MMPSHHAQVVLLLLPHLSSLTLVVAPCLNKIYDWRMEWLIDLKLSFGIGYQFRRSVLENAQITVLLLWDSVYE